LSINYLFAKNAAKHTLVIDEMSEKHKNFVSAPLFKWRNQIFYKDVMLIDCPENKEQQISEEQKKMKFG
jgi:hypothetical protein